MPDDTDCSNIHDDELEMHVQLQVCNVVVQASEDSLDTNPLSKFLVSRLAQKLT